MKVILSAKASQQLLELFDYLEKSFSAEVRRKFQKRFDRYVQAIKLVPQGFPISSIFDGCRKCVVSRQTSIIYRLQNEVIEIVALLDNRSHH